MGRLLSAAACYSFPVGCRKARHHDRSWQARLLASCRVPVRGEAHNGVRQGPVGSHLIIEEGAVETESDFGRIVSALHRPRALEVRTPGEALDLPLARRLEGNLPQS